MVNSEMNEYDKIVDKLIDEKTALFNKIEKLKKEIKKLKEENRQLRKENKNGV